MNINRGATALCAIVGGSAMLLFGSPVRAQQESRSTGAAASTELEEVIVTARKREESILNVPVIETALPQAKIESLQVVSMTDLASVVPGLDFGRNLLSIGTQVSLRGIGSSSYDQGVDSSVALYVDGMAPGTGLAFQSGFFDMNQIEVLKGPQALFYGKSTPGGVISLRTADPTDKFEVIGRLAYDFEAKTNREEAIVSGPVSDSVKLRLAAMYQNSEGYFYERATATPGLGGVTPTDDRTPNSRNYQIRGTLLWNPIDQFDARLKVNLVHDHVLNEESSQYTDCPQGTSFTPAGINFFPPACGVSRNSYVVWMSPAAFPGILNNGAPLTDSQQQFGTLEMNYRPTQSLTVTSLTTDYLITSANLVNAIETAGAAPPIVAENLFRRVESTEELRVNSDFNGPFNFTAGGFYENGQVTENVLLLGNTALKLPALLVDGYNTVGIRTYSFFGQGRYKILPQLELAAGVRWSDEKRSESPRNVLTNLPVSVTTPVVKSVNTAPEFTLTYRPTDEFTAFAAYKQAYKSGSFKLSTPPNPGDNNAFDEEKAQGGEAGIKTRLLDRHLALNAAAYLYNYSGLQVGAISPAVNGVPVITTVNAGAARSYGVDLDAAYNPPAVEGLGLNAAVNWNHARYQTLDNVPCWGGQTIALGCSNLLNPVTGHFTAQNLNGTPLLRAPNWQGNLGFNYRLPLPRSYQLVFTNSNALSGRYVTALAVGRPNNDNYQGGYLKSDLGLSLVGPDESWELALIVKNVGDRLTYGTTGISDFAAGVALGRDGVTQFEGATTSGRDGIDQTNAFVDPGREIWIRLTVRPFASSK